MQAKQWQYGMTLVFGLLVFVMPWLLGFESIIPIRSWDFFVVGVATVVCAAAALHLRARVAQFAVPALGVWMVASPWVLGFDGNISARNSALVLGAMIFLVALWAILERARATRESTGGVAQT